MAPTVTTEDVRRLLGDGAQALEVLPPSAFAKEHLPGAVNIPLWQLDARSASVLDRARPVVVYCYDTECDLSARGAALLEQLGFEQVYDYTGSKTAWLAAGQPGEGTLAAEDRAGALADPACPTCGAEEPCTKALAGGDDLVVVLDDRQVLLGALRSSARELDVPAWQAMDPGPATVRPSIDRWELARSMDEEGQDHVLVTRLDGTLIGLLPRERLRGG
jgi:rhodanese-related sulfurtransferase